MTHVADERLVFSEAHTLASLIRERVVSATEVLEAHLTQIRRHNPALNAIVTLAEDGARTRARAADTARARSELWGPLHGVPVTVKDSIETAGLRTTSGAPSLATYVPDTDAPVVARLRAAGAIVLGKSNLPEFAGGSQTENPLFGRTNNPWDLTRTPGGSTGGGAAAVAAGLSPLEIGSDFGGSLRTPAHYCGVYALKPTEQRVPFAGHIPPLPGAPRTVRHLAVLGPLARSVEDLALALRLIAGPHPRDMDVPPVPLEPAAERPLSTLRLAWTEELGGVVASAETGSLLAALAGELGRQGCTVTRLAPDGFGVAAAWETFGELVQAEFGAGMTPEHEAQQAHGFDALAADAPPWFQHVLRGRARRVNASFRCYAAALVQRDALIAALEEFLHHWDALLCPVAPGPAFAHCPPGSPVAYDGVFCTPFNVTGHPVVVVPIGRSAQGLPIGVQIVGRRWAEMDLLHVAARLAEVAGPFQRPPGY